MKRIINAVVIVVMLCLVCFASDTAVNSDTAYYHSVSVFVDGEELVSDQSALLMDSRTMVPLRAIFEKLGTEVLWEDATQRITAIKDGLEIELIIGQNHMRVGKKIVYLDVAPILLNSRTLVPLRAVSEAFGNKVKWDGNTMTVTVESLPEALESAAKKDIILAEDGKRYAVYYNENGKHILTQWLTYSASGELTPSKTVEEIIYTATGNLEKRLHIDGTLELFGYDDFDELSHYEIHRPDGSFKKYDFYKWRNGYLLGKTEENGESTDIGNKITVYEYYNGWETLKNIKDNYGLNLDFYYVSKDEYESGTYGENVQGAPTEYVTVVSDGKIKESYVGGFEKYTSLEFYNAGTDIFDNCVVLETEIIAVDENEKSSAIFEGINYRKAMETGKDERFVTEENGTSSKYMHSMASVLCDVMYNFDYRDTKALGEAYTRMYEAMGGRKDGSNYKPEEYTYPDVYKPEESIEKKIISEAFFASSPENCTELANYGTISTVKGYLYIKYISFDDPDFTLELNKWYRTEVEVTYSSIGYTHSHSYSATIRSKNFEEVPEELLI